jgi:DNA end-binding protein Ku
LNSGSFGVLRANGTPRQLEGFFARFARDLPGGPLPATSDADKISFNQINKQTGPRIRYTRLDATGEEVPYADITKAFKVDTDTYVEVTKDELEEIALESTRTIDIDQFVPRDQTLRRSVGADEPSKKARKAAADGGKHWNSPRWVGQ